MKIYEVNGRKVWLDKAPEGYEVKKPEKVEPKVEEPKVEPVKEEEPKTKAKRTPSNKGRKAGNNK